MCDRVLAADLQSGPKHALSCSQAPLSLFQCVGGCLALNCQWQPQQAALVVGLSESV